ncbi:MAG: GTP-binding protein [Gemmatimonadota bacterium]|nr:MAG: GTP-binding protein [Gemmatimonadota bacterium]
MKRILSLAILLAWPAGLPAQQAAVMEWTGLYQLERRPDYFAEIVREDPTAITLPAPPPGEPPAVVRGLYLNAWVFGGARFYDLVALADTTEINAFVIDVKDGTGYVTYRSSVPTAVAIGANGLVRARDVRERLALLRRHGIHPIARIVVAKDPLLAEHRPQWAVQHVAGGLWRDRFGDPWVDAYRDSVWMYAGDIAGEAVLMGFRELQFDYVRFPDEPAENLARAVFPARGARETRRSGIRRNLNLLGDRVRALGVPFTLDVFGLTTSSTNDLGIGQYWEDVLQAADVVLPMVYPSHYGRGAYGFDWPNSHPYEVVTRALQDGMRRAEGLSGAARIRPFLQSFSIRRVRYTASEVRAEIQAVEDLGLTDWVLWNASGRYPAGALRPTKPPPVATPGQARR